MDPANYVLLVEDDPIIVQFMLRALQAVEPAPMVVHAADGVDAVDYLHARGPYEGRKPGLPSLILLDVVMPKVDGLDVLLQIKSAEPLRSIPVVMLTSTTDHRVLQESYRLGANAFVAKPIDFQQFQDMIRQVFSFWMSINMPPPNSSAVGLRFQPQRISISQ